MDVENRSAFELGLLVLVIPVFAPVGAADPVAGPPLTSCQAASSEAADIQVTS